MKRKDAPKSIRFEKIDKTRVTDVGSSKLAVSVKDQIRQQVSFEVDAALAKRDEKKHGTFDEEDDFEDEEPEPIWLSGKEVQEMAPDEEHMHVPADDQEDEPRESGRTADGASSDDDGVPDKARD